MSFKRIPFVAAFLAFLNPGFSRCAKCRLPWNHCKPKSVKTSKSNGTFATCDVCWDNSTLEELKSYYEQVYMMQKKQAFLSGYEMNHSLEHLLDCVEKEYNKTRK